MSYLAERIQGPILYQTTDEFYEFSSTELNCLKRVKAFRPNVSLDEALQSETQCTSSNMAQVLSPLSDFLVPFPVRQSPLLHRRTLHVGSASQSGASPPKKRKKKNI